METEKFEQFIAKLAAELPRKLLTYGAKDRAWSRIQNHLRMERAAQTQKTGFVFGSLFHLGKLATIAIIAALAVIILGGATKASESSIPGDALYSVKRATENVETILATNDQAKVTVGVKLAQRRLAEVKSLVAEKKEPQVVAQTLQDLKATTEQVISAASASKPELVDTAIQLVTEEKQVLSTVTKDAQGEAKTALQDAITSSTESLAKLQNDNSANGAEVKGVTTNTENASSTTPAAKPKKPDGVMQSNMQIQGVANPDTSPDKNTEPKILPEPTVGF